MRYVSYNAATWFDTVSKVLGEFKGRNVWFASLVFSKENLHPEIASLCSEIWEGDDKMGKWDKADVLVIDNFDYLKPADFSFIKTWSEVTDTTVVIFVQEKRK